MDIYEKVTRFYQSVKTEKRSIGRSVFGRELYAVKAGEGRPIGIAQYAIHGREFITSMLAMEQYKIGAAKGSCWFLPLVNPDGALLSEKGLLSVKEEKDRLFLISINDGSQDFSLWKANGRGVDLNVNFDADWGKGVKNVRIAGRENYIGEFPFSEPETRVLKAFTEEIAPDYTLSYHTKGEEIYWYYKQQGEVRQRHLKIAQTIANSTKYPLANAKGSVGGYKDWCVLKYQIPSFTIEAGADKFSHPLKEEALENIVNVNRLAVYDLSKEIGKI